MNEHAGGVTGQTKGPRHVCDYCWVAGAVTCLVTVNGDQLLPSCGYTFAVTSRANVPVAAVLNVAEPDPLLIDPFDARLNPFRLNVALNHPFAVGLTPTAAVQVCPVHNKLETDNVGTVVTVHGVSWERATGDWSCHARCSLKAAWDQAEAGRSWGTAWPAMLAVQTSAR